MAEITEGSSSLRRESRRLNLENEDELLMLKMFVLSYADVTVPYVLNQQHCWATACLRCDV